nr:hypothetical protein [Tanacetum cinerariifolium]
DNDFHAGWREGLAKVLGWAQHVAEKYERSRKKAEEWYASELSSSQTSSSAQKRGGKGKAPSTATKVKPPTDIRLFRFPLPSES